MHQKLTCLLVFVFLAATACSKKTLEIFGKPSLIGAGIDSSLVKKRDFSINFSTHSKKQLKVTYLGSGGYYIGDKQDAILIDPFFSHHAFLSIPFKKIATKPLAVSAGLDSMRDELYEKVRGVFVAHSHYDHLMDVPFVFNHYLDTTKSDLKVYGSESTQTILRGILKPKRLANIESNQSDIKVNGEWIYLENTNFRVLPIKTSHAPHFKKLITVSLYKGEAKPIENFRSDTAKTRAGKWKGGKTMAFLIDLMADSVVQFRMYIQSSASEPPDGYVNKTILSEVPVHLAILGAASFANVDDYPEGLIKNLEYPDKIIIGHWEDFFKPYQDRPKRLVRLTNIKKFLIRLNKIHKWKIDGEEQFYMPEPGVTVELKY